MRGRLARVMMALALGVGAWGCGRSTEEHAASSQGALSPSSTAFFLPWGAGDAHVGLRPNARDHLAQGPAAVVVTDAGHVLVLDGVNRRVLELAPDGKARTARPSLPADADDLALAPNGSIAIFGALTRDVSFLDERVSGVVHVPTTFVDVDRVAVGPSRRVSFRTAFGETFTLGSPSFPLPLDVVLASKKEGAAILADGSGVRAVVTHDETGAHAALVRTHVGETGETRTMRTFTLDADAVHVEGASGAIVCARLEHVAADGDAIAVKREAVCVDMDRGRETMRVDLGAPGLYVPRGELAVGGSPPLLAFAHPEDDGLRVSLTRVDGDAR